MHIILVYMGIFLGIVFEGEMIMISSIIAAHHGYLNFWIVLSIGIVGTFFTDFFYFSLGKKKGKDIIAKKEKIKGKMDFVKKKISKNPFLIFLSYRFMYGFRSITPLIIGSSNFHTRRFVLNSFISILLWAGTYGALGYYLGNLIKKQLGHIEHIEKYIIAALVLVAVTVIIIRKTKKKKNQILAEEETVNL